MHNPTNWDLPGCARCSSECNYRCCDQSPDSAAPQPDNALLLYPGELEESSLPKGHIITTMEDFFRGRLGYCDREHFDQTTCNAAHNFKPLDCRSYPFFPAIVGGKLALRMDSSRCPLTRDLPGLRAHYRRVYDAWSRVLEEHPDVAGWIAAVELPDYTIVQPLFLETSSV